MDQDAPATAAGPSATCIEYAARISADFKIKECPAFISCSGGRQTKGPKVLAFNDCDIPLTPDGFEGKKQVGVGLVVVDCLSEGYTRVPYECSNGVFKVGENAQPLSQKASWADDPEGTLSMLKCWPYGILEGCPKDKDDRNEEYKWEVHPGMVLRVMFWPDSWRASGDKGPSSADKSRGVTCNVDEGVEVIKAFTLMEVELVCKGWSKWEPGDVNPEAKNKPREICPVKKGYGMSATAITPLPNATLYSVLSTLPRVIPANFDNSKMKQQGWQSTFSSIKNVIQSDKVPFFVGKVNASATVDLDERPEMANEPPQIRLSRWCADASNSKGVDTESCIDILHDAALRATNCPDINSACALIELAANAGALSVVVCANQYRPGKERIRSMLYGYPLIDTKQLLRGIQTPVDPASVYLDASGNYLVFETDFKVLFPPACVLDGCAGESGIDGGAQDDDGAAAMDDEAAEGKPAAMMQTDIDEEGEMLCPHLHISKEALTHIKGAEAVKSPDFMLVGNNVKLQKGYYARFVHPSMSDPEKPQQHVVLWGGYVSMCKPQITMPGLGFNILAGASGAAAAMAAAGAVAAARNKRTRWMAEEARRFDPFGGAAAAASSAPAGLQRLESSLGAKESKKQQEAPASNSSSASGSKKKGRAA